MDQRDRRRNGVSVRINHFALLLFLAGCEADDGGGHEAFQTTPGPTMRPGDNCLRCHNPLGQAARRPWSAAGTVFPTLDAERTEGVPGVTVSIEDAEGQLVVPPCPRGTWPGGTRRGSIKIPFSPLRGKNVHVHAHLQGWG
jgi:hypothetical protein